MHKSQLENHETHDPTHDATRLDSKMIEILTTILTAIIMMHMPTLSSTGGGLVSIS